VRVRDDPASTTAPGANLHRELGNAQEGITSNPLDRSLFFTSQPYYLNNPYFSRLYIVQ